MDSIAQQIQALQAKDQRLQGFKLSTDQWTRLRGPGTDVVAAWEALRAEALAMKVWPVITGQVGQAGLLYPEHRADLTEIERHFAEARALDLAGWIQTQWQDINQADFAADAADFEAELEDELGGMGQLANLIQPNHRTCLDRDLLTQTFHAEAEILLLPVGHSWEIPAHLSYGDWNACPPTAVHLRLLEDWYLKYEADLIGLSGDVMELKIRKPVTDMDSALKLARVQYAFCPDIVEQGVMSIENLASSLIDSTIWYFWWD